MAVIEQLLADLGFHAASEENAVGQDDGHHAVIFEVLKAVQEEGEVGSRLGCDAWFLKRMSLAVSSPGDQRRLKGWVGDHCIEGGLLGRVFFAEAVPLVVEGVAVVDLELGILHSVQEHVHPGEIAPDVLLLSEDLSDGATFLLDLPLDV